MYSFKPQGICPKRINIQLDGNTVEQVEFIGGCNGNLKAISRVVQGMTVEEVAELFEGNTCGPRKTSCVDQLVKGLREAAEKQG